MKKIIYCLWIMQVSFSFVYYGTKSWVLLTYIKQQEWKVFQRQLPAYSDSHCVALNGPGCYNTVFAAYVFYQ